jgi:hypothetical protein
MANKKRKSGVALIFFCRLANLRKFCLFSSIFLLQSWKLIKRHKLNVTLPSQVVRALLLWIFFSLRAVSAAVRHRGEKLFCVSTHLAGEIIMNPQNILLFLSLPLPWQLVARNNLISTSKKFSSP